ncbi:MAG: hypothetical protein M1839_004109 [Geoglossum umbratile]|nr:MAG: hypothetical protein M1839_004109 [Geoglossum umbratile]
MLIQNALLLLSSATLALSASAPIPTTPSSDAAAKSGWTGKLSSLDGGLQGTVKVLSPTSLVISNFQLGDAGAPALYWWGATDGNLKGGFRISNVQVKEVSTGKDLQVALDAGKTVADFATVGLWCERFGVDFGQATLQPGGADAVESPAGSAAPQSGAAVTMGIPLRLGVAAGVAGAVYLFL